MFSRLLILALITSMACQAEVITKHTCVVGAGPAGILAICKILDYKTPAHEIAWVDPDFCVGRFGKYYQGIRMVSANDYNILFLSISDTMRSIIPDVVEWCDANRGYAPLIGEIVAPLQKVTNHLLEQTPVTGVREQVSALVRNSDGWVVCAGQTLIQCQRVILATGFEPKHLEYPIEEVPLDYAMTPATLAPLISTTDTVALFGNGLSAQLVVKSLAELGVRSVIRVLPGDQEPTIAGNTLSIGYLHPERDLYVHECSKIIYAIGYNEQLVPHHSSENIIRIQKMGLNSIALQVRERL